jgi:WD40 repeat protein
VFSPDGSQLAVLGFQDALHLYDTTGRKPTVQLTCPCRDTRTLAYSPDGSLLAAGGRNGRIRVWRLSDLSEVRSTPTHTLRVRDMAFSPDGSLLVSAGEDRTIRVCEAATGREVFVLPTGACKVYCLAHLHDGRWAAGGSDNRIHLWDFERREEVGVLDGHTGTVAGLAVDGTTLFSASYDTTIRLWTTQAVPAIAERPVEQRAALPSSGIQ